MRSSKISSISMPIIMGLCMALGVATIGRRATADPSDEQYRNDQGGYTIAFDGAPDETSLQQQFGDVTLTMHMDMVRKDNPRWAFCVCYMDTGRDVPIDAVAPSMIRSMAGKLGDPDSTAQITIDGEQGKEYIFHPGLAFIRCRIVSHQHHVYAILDGGPQSEEGSDADLHFADSFHFTDQEN